jgi:signal transduction histidine kinase
VKAIGFQKD